MAGDDDMGRDEMVARIAVLEAMVLKLTELVIRGHQKSGDGAALDGFVYSLGEAIGQRGSQMKEPQASIYNSHWNAMLRVLADLTQPDDRAKN